MLRSDFEGNLQIMDWLWRQLWDEFGSKSATPDDGPNLVLRWFPYDFQVPNGFERHTVCTVGSLARFATFLMLFGIRSVRPRHTLSSKINNICVDVVFIE